MKLCWWNVEWNNGSETESGLRKNVCKRVIKTFTGLFMYVFMCGDVKELRVRITPEEQNFHWRRCLLCKTRSAQECTRRKYAGETKDARGEREKNLGSAPGGSFVSWACMQLASYRTPPILRPTPVHISVAYPRTLQVKQQSTPFSPYFTYGAVHPPYDDSIYKS